MAPEVPPVYRLPFQIATHEVDACNHWHLHALTQRLQEAAGQHAQRLGYGYGAMPQQGVFWVMVELALQLHRLPGWTEAGQVHTWIVDHGVLRGRRDLEIRSTTGNLWVQAATVWALLDARTHRPLRLNTVARSDLPRFPERTVLDLPRFRWDPEGPPDHEQADTVRWTDVDLQGHLNNTQHLRLAVDHLPPNWLLAHRPVFVHVRFLREARVGDPLQIRLWMSDDRTFHEILRTSDGQPLARIQITWTQEESPCIP
ncbi:MAG: thioesterase [Candidatus Hydrothermae bacterium]|nr:thioesterase [Candidatus Hydrothermae bacterium]